MLFATYTGLRASEQRRLLWSDIDVPRSQLFVRKSKHGKSRYIPLNTAALEALKIASRCSKGTTHPSTTRELSPG